MERVQDSGVERVAMRRMVCTGPVMASVVLSVRPSIRIRKKIAEKTRKVAKKPRLQTWPKIQE
jgi:hypothetical protein